MNQKHCLLVMAFAGVLSLAPLPAFSGNLSNFSDALEQLADMTRAADRAHDALNDAMQGGRDYSRYDRDWRNAESRLERARIRTMAHIAGGESRIRSCATTATAGSALPGNTRSIRVGSDTGSLADHDRDKWKGVPPDLPRRRASAGQAKSSKNTTTRNIEIEKGPSVEEGLSFTA
ncbi:MAG: hypothetical protein ACLRWP_13535 [Bilophila wadsworthia]